MFRPEPALDHTLTFRDRHVFDRVMFVDVGQNLLCLEAMKTELMITAPVGGTVKEIRCKPGALVTPGQTLILVATL